MDSPVERIAELPDDLPAYIVLPCPMYLPCEKAAKVLGVRKAVVAKMLNDPIDPIPYVTTGEKGAKKLVSIIDARDYMRRRHYANVG